MSTPGGRGPPVPGRPGGRALSRADRHRAVRRPGQVSGSVVRVVDRAGAGEVRAGEAGAGEPRLVGHQIVRVLGLVVGALERRHLVVGRGEVADPVAAGAGEVRAGEVGTGVARAGEVRLVVALRDPARTGAPAAPRAVLRCVAHRCARPLLARPPARNECAVAAVVAPARQRLRAKGALMKVRNSLRSLKDRPGAQIVRRRGKVFSDQPQGPRGKAQPGLTRGRPARPRPPHPYRVRRPRRASRRSLPDRFPFRFRVPPAPARCRRDPGVPRGGWGSCGLL